MRQALALLAAAAMVGGSLYLRYGGDGSGEGDGAGRGGRVQLVCDPAFRAACGDLDADVTIEDAAQTAGRLVDEGAAAPDAWLTPGPWPAMVDELSRGSGPPRFPEVGVVAETGLGVVAPFDLDDCGWRCLGIRVGDDALEVGWGGADAALGPLVLGAVSVGYFRGEPFATNDFTSDFNGYVNRFRQEAERAPDPALRLVQTGGAAFDAAVTLGAGTEDLLQRESSRLTLLYPDPVVAVEAVLAGGDGDLADALRRALADLGWDGPGGGATNLPSAGVLAALWDRSR